MSDISNLIVGSISPIDCKHPRTLLISSERGPSDRRAHAHICRECGLITVWINGERMTFTLVSDEHVEAAGQYARFLSKQEG